MEELIALIVDVDDAHNLSLSQAAEACGFTPRVARGSEEAIRLAKEAHPTIAFIALDVDDDDGLALLEVPEIAGAEDIVLINDVDDPPRVHDGIRAGATYFSCKPLDDAFLRTLLSDLAAEVRASASSTAPNEACPIDQFGLLRGSAPVMRRLYRVVRKVAPSMSSVLLVGESGTGKELVARTLHMFSYRAEGPFVACNCSAIAKDLFESELFGHEKGSFSGATARHKGFFERAAGGTLFLDEITEMATELQVKLLRVLEQNEFRRVGGEADLTSDIRLIAATNRNPAQAIEEGALREDLYYRIAQFPIHLPPLRNRGTDIGGLANYFLNALNEEHETQRTLSDAAIAALASYHWPGNVRELMSVIERAHILAGEVIDADDLSFDDLELGSGDTVRISVGSSIGDAERKLIFATLEANGGDKPRTADALGISLKTLYNRLNEYSANDEESGDGP